MPGKQLFTSQFDAATELKDGSVNTAASAGSVSGTARVVNIGNAFAAMVAIIDVDAIDLASNDEAYTIAIQGSTTPDFSADVVVLTSVRFGKAAIIGQSADRGVGRAQIPFYNSVDGLNPYPFLRAFMNPVGTTPSINYRAFLTKPPTN